MSICWRPEWCECPECGPLVRVDVRTETRTRWQHEPTCAYYGLPFKAGSANQICPCPANPELPSTSAHKCEGDGA